MISTVKRLLAEERDATVLGLARLAFSTLMILNAIKLGRAAMGGYFADYFHLPLLPAALVPSRTVYLGLIALELAGSVLGLAGVYAREGLFLAASIGLFLLGCDRLDYHNNRYVLLLFAFLLAFMPCDRAFVLRRRMPSDSERVGPTWARRLLQVQVSLVYLASAGSKLIDADWRTGQVLHVRYEKALAAAQAQLHVPDLLASTLNSPSFAEITSKLAISTELFLAIGLWLGKTRALALWLGAMFHLSIEIAAHVESFSFVMWAAYLAFCVPELRERQLVYDPASRAGRLAAALVRRLDWLQRFEIAPQSNAAASPLGIAAVDRDRRAYRGVSALALVARAVPVFFPFWLPLLGLGYVTSRTQRA